VAVVVVYPCGRFGLVVAVLVVPLRPRSSFSDGQIQIAIQFKSRFKHFGLFHLSNKDLVRNALIAFRLIHTMFNFKDLELDLGIAF